jgi:hypothetical protein
MSMLVDYATLGGTVITGAELRALTDEAKPDPSSPGLTIPQVVAAARLLHVPIGSNPRGNTTALLENLRLGRAFVVPGLYARVPDNLSGQPTYDKQHAVLALELAVGRANVVVGDPLRATWTEWPISVLIAYWSGYGSIYAYSRDVPEICAA